MGRESDMTWPIESGKLRPVIDQTYPLSEAREAVRLVGSSRARAKVVITA